MTAPALLLDMCRQDVTAFRVKLDIVLWVVLPGFSLHGFKLLWLQLWYATAAGSAL